MTTAPRDQSTLDDCLSSLTAAGWKQARLFIDGHVTLSKTASEFPATQRDPQIGAWPNYYLALVELLMRDPDADAYMLLQDDVVFFRDPSLRGYLEKLLWPGRRPGLVSLYCSAAYTRPRDGWHRLRQSMVWGGPALVFSPGTLVAFLSDRRVAQHRRSGRKGLASIDWLIGEWAWRTRTLVHIPTPSLVQHVGHVSSLWPGERAFGSRRANRFAGHAVAGDESDPQSRSTHEHTVVSLTHPKREKK